MVQEDSETYSSPFSVSMLSRVKCGPLFYFLSCSEVHTKMPELTLTPPVVLATKRGTSLLLNKSNKEDRIKILALEMPNIVWSRSFYSCGSKILYDE